MIFRIASRLRADQAGVTAVEFALITPVLMITLMGLFDVGYNMYTNQMLNGAIQKTARDSTIEGASNQLTALDDRVADAVKTVAYGASLTFSRTAFASFTDIDHGEDFDDLNGDGICDAGEPFEDANANLVWDPKQGTAGLGGARDAVLYRVKVTYPRLFPIFAFMPGQSKTFSLESVTVLRNQPYGTTSTTPPQMGNCA